MPPAAIRMPATALACLAGALAFGQVIEFDSAGLRYQALTRGGLTIMFAHLPAHVRDFAIVQLAVSNGSGKVYIVRPEDCVYELDTGVQIRAQPARAVVDALLDGASRNDVIKMVGTYEIGLYGLSRFQSTNGYERRRQSAQAELGSGRLKAAAAASAIAFVLTKLTPGQSTDGAVFFRTAGKPLGPGRLRIRAGGELFEFQPGTSPSGD